jgi:hypothetical protein
VSQLVNQQKIRLNESVYPYKMKQRGMLKTQTVQDGDALNTTNDEFVQFDNACRLEGLRTQRAANPDFVEVENTSRTERLRKNIRRMQRLGKVQKQLNEPCT